MSRATPRHQLRQLHRLGFGVGIIAFLPLSDTVKNYTQPQVLWSWITGFVVYAILAKAGAQPESLPLNKLEIHVPAQA
jgi:hypothetical protein